MTRALDWEDAVGRAWADMYPQTDRSFSGLTQRLIERIGLFPGDTVLDVGCGAGELSLAIMRSRTRARVLGVDVSPHLIVAASERSGAREWPQFVQGDAATWSQEDFSPDLLVSRHGVMFFDDPVAAFSHLHAIAAPGASLVFSCFRSPRDNRWASDLVDLAGSPPIDQTVPGPFAFADPQRVEAILGEAGWRGIDFEPVDFAYIAGMGPNAMAEASDYFHRIGPAATPLAALEGSAREAVEAKLQSWIARHRSGEMIALGAAAWIVSARRG